MSPSQGNVREQVMAQIITTMEEAIAAGRDPMKLAEATYPGTPDTVLFIALADAEDRRTEAWWRTIERSLDEAVVWAAIVEAACEPAPAGPREAELDAAFAALVSSAERAA